MNRRVSAIVQALEEGERRLADDLRATARRHRDDHEVHHVAHDLARWSDEHSRRLAEAVGADVASDGSGPPDLPPAPPRASASDDPALRLLEDLRALHQAVAGNCAYWLMLSQAAEASHDSRLLDLVGLGRPRALRQLDWTKAMMTSQSPQILTTPP
ncbi:hypothetical protein ACIGO8_10725 [Streptomyces sp. NPDC053493]|uniref:hypothetical protein n=1 Tax=Streptomyces sp. NPDC053493 TaxID=3365705 RepID=UPI0037D19ED4